MKNCSLLLFLSFAVLLSNCAASRLLAEPMPGETQKDGLVEIAPDVTKKEKTVSEFRSGGKAYMRTTYYLNGDMKIENFRKDGTLEAISAIVTVGAERIIHIIKYQLDGKLKVSELKSGRDLENVTYHPDGVTTQIKLAFIKDTRTEEHFDTSGQITWRSVEQRTPKHGRVSAAITVFAANGQEDYTWTAVPNASGDLVLTSVTEHLGKGRKRVISFVGNTPSSATYFDANGAIERTEAFDKLSPPFDMTRAREPKP